MTAHDRDYLLRTIATVRNHRGADNCWPQWANIFADEIERLWKQRDKLLARLVADPDRAAIATLDGLQKLLPELLAEDVEQAGLILDWIGVAGDLSLAERVRILALQVATGQGYTLEEAERLAPPAFRAGASHSQKEPS